MAETRAHERSSRVVAWFLALSYGIGAPAAAILEHGSQLLSQRFDLPPWLIYLTCAVQLASALGILVRPLAPWAAAALTATTLGAIASHLRIHSPMTALPALVFTGVQVWYIFQVRASPSGPGAEPG